MNITDTDRKALRSAVLAALVKSGNLQAINEGVKFPARFNEDKELAAIISMIVADGEIQITLDVAGRRVLV